MRRWPWREVTAIVVPLVGIVLAVSVPLVRYAMRERDERLAVGVLQQVDAAQRDHHLRTRTYATSVASLIESCNQGVSLPTSLLDALTAAGYALQLRSASGAAVTGADCHGAPLARRSRPERTAAFTCSTTASLPTSVTWPGGWRHRSRHERRSAFRKDSLRSKDSALRAS
jgi:type II secretory pathway pseudopilin PulG